MQRLLLTGAALLSLGLAACGNQPETGENQAAAAGEQGFEALENAEGLSTATAYLKRAELHQVLEGAGSYTFFAPTDQAFAAIPQEQRQVLETEEGRPQLIALIRQHMAPGYFTAQDIAKAVQSAEGQVDLASLGAAPIAVRNQGETIVLGEGSGSARIVGEPIQVGNSIVHRIDRVLPPPPAE